MYAALSPLLMNFMVILAVVSFSHNIISEVSIHRRKLLLGFKAGPPPPPTYQYVKARLLLSPTFQKCLHVVHTGVCVHNIQIAVPSKYLSRQSQCSVTLVFRGFSVIKSSQEAR